jgi:ABC-type Fe3+-hydroxamate transport system substrate-binding protein
MNERLEKMVEMMDKSTMQFMLFDKQEKQIAQVIGLAADLIEKLEQRDQLIAKLRSKLEDLEAKVSALEEVV